ncbi:F-box domain [Macleaya cordata]|uniref:F-box domain n=1 Tax=Macleaya cordata TaxID=56857 RepID=A0A200QVB9_MACCD|nr:F-box domain [Macleaya cordata]
MKTRNSPFHNNEDRISNLPEVLIHHILSFIDMKYAVQTSVLSRRWRYIWASLPTLILRSYLFRLPHWSNTHVEGFVDFVDRVLMLRDSSNIHSIRLDWNGSLAGDIDVPSRLNTWTLAAVRRNVQELSIYLSVWLYQTIQFPPCLFTCKSLTKLELDFGSKYESGIILPNSIDLPMLKFLKLRRVSIEDEKSSAKLFSSCPALESLIIEKCCVNLKNVFAPKLKHFTIRYNYDKTDESKVLSIKLYAPNLVSFVCKSYMLLDYSLENLSSLVTAYIDMMLEDEQEENEPETFATLSTEVKELYAQRMMKLLRALHNVKVLTLSPWILEKYPYDPRMYPFCDEINSNSPNNIGDDWEEAGLSLPCMLYHLKFVKIFGVKGCINELKFLEILLKNAMVLQQVVLYRYWQGPDASLDGRGYEQEALIFISLDLTCLHLLCRNMKRLI